MQRLIALLLRGLDVGELEHSGSLGHHLCVQSLSCFPHSLRIDQSVRCGNLFLIAKDELVLIDHADGFFFDFLFLLVSSGGGLLGNRVHLSRIHLSLQFLKPTQCL